MPLMTSNELSKAYQELYAKVGEILLRYDPVGIISGDISDEYNPEVSTILPRLKAAHSGNDVHDILYEEFVHWFGADTAGNRDNPTYEDAATEIWTVWNEFKSKTAGGSGTHE